MGCSHFYRYAALAWTMRYNEPDCDQAKDLRRGMDDSDQRTTTNVESGQNSVVVARGNERPNVGEGQDTINGRGKKRPRRPDLRVQWDEETIAEHDKDRGKRQKIDEPPTPWARSPASTSEDEEEEADGTSGVHFDELGLEGSKCPTPQSSPKGDVVAASPFAGKLAADPGELFARLDQLAQTRESPEVDVDDCGANAETAGDLSRSPAHDDTRRVQLFTGAEEPKGSSAAFKAKRAAHYNEFQVMQAFRQRQALKGKNELDEDIAN